MRLSIRLARGREGEIPPRHPLPPPPGKAIEEAPPWPRDSSLSRGIYLRSLGLSARCMAHWRVPISMFPIFRFGLASTAYGAPHREGGSEVGVSGIVSVVSKRSIIY